MKWIWFAVKNVLRNRRRSAVTVLIAAVGTAAVLVGGGFALYTYESLREMAARESGHLVVAHQDYFAQDEASAMEHGLAAYETLSRGLEQDPRVRTTIPRLQFSGLITNGDKSTIFIGSGVDPRREFTVRGPFLRFVDGAVLSSRPPAGEEPQVVLGRDLARQLGAGVGSSLTLLSTTTQGALNALDVRVQGVFTLGVPDLDRRALYVTLPTAQVLLATDKVSTLSVYLSDTEDTAALRAEVQRDLPEYALRTWRELAFYYTGVKGLYDRIFGLLGAVIVIIVFFAVSNTLSMTVMERTREIGTSRALGAYPGQVTRNFVLEAMVLGVAGAALGMLLALGVWLFFQTAGLEMPPPPGRSEGYPLYIYLSLRLYGVAALAVVLVSMAAAWLSSRGAARKPIVEALAHV